VSVCAIFAVYGRKLSKKVQTLMGALVARKWELCASELVFFWIFVHTQACRLNLSGMTGEPSKIVRDRRQICGCLLKITDVLAFG